MAAILLLTLIIPISASNTTSGIYEFNDVTIQFQNDSVFTLENQQEIADFIAYGYDDSIETYNLICDLFSHKYETEIVIKTTHKVRTTAPRCLKESYKVSVCSRCGHTTEELISSEYINCHQ